MPENDFNSSTTTPRPMVDGDITPPPAGTGFTPAAPLKDAGTEFSAATENALTDVKQEVTQSAGNLQQQAGDKLRQFADMGKERAGGYLDQLAQMLTDAAGQVDGKLGAQYGSYARNAADTVQGLSQQVREQDLDALVVAARDFVRKSPGVAIGAAATIGFVLSRLAQSGIDADRG